MALLYRCNSTIYLAARQQYKENPMLHFNCKYEGNVLLLFHDNNGYGRTPQFYVRRLLPILFTSQFLSWRKVKLADWYELSTSLGLYFACYEDVNTIKNMKKPQQ